MMSNPWHIPDERRIPCSPREGYEWIRAMDEAAMITVRCRYCNGHFERTGSSGAQYCCDDCRWWATHDESWDLIPVPAQQTYTASEVIAWLNPGRE